MTDYLNFLKGFQTVISAYQDISTIYSKLESQGFLEKIVAVLVEVFNDEHEFTLNELRKYGKENNQKEEDFLEEQYELNSSIFRRNLSLIVQNLSEEIGRSFLDRFKKEQNSESRRNHLGIRVEHNIMDENKITPTQKPQYKSDMPEIQEEIESTGKVSPIKISPKSKRSPIESELLSNTARSFELNIEELNLRTRLQQEISIPWGSQPTSGSELPAKHDTINGVSPITASNRRDHMKSSSSKNLNTDNLMLISNELKKSNKDLRSPNSDRDFERVPTQGHVRSISYERTSLSSSQGKGASARGFSPNSKANKSPGGNPSSSKNSVMGSTYDPAVLDSEFSHTRGLSFGRSARPGLFNQGDVPGPGAYESEDGLSAVKKKVTVPSFARSPKYSIFDKVLNESPGAIYYPSKHFVSK